MAGEPRRIKVRPGSEFERLIAEVGATPVVLDNDGELYLLNRLEREPEDIFQGYNPELIKEAIATTAGSWADLDIDAIVADIYRAREEGSRPASRP